MMDSSLFLGKLALSLLLVIRRRHAHDFREQAREVVAVVDSYLVTNLVNFHVGEVQQIAGMLYFQLVEIVYR